MLGELEGMLGGFDAESLNSDTGETQTDNDAEKTVVIEMRTHCLNLN
jgi:hypothetical protein